MGPEPPSQVHVEGSGLLGSPEHWYRGDWGLVQGLLGSGMGVTGMLVQRLLGTGTEDTGCRSEGLRGSSSLAEQLWVCGFDSH